MYRAQCRQCGAWVAGDYEMADEWSWDHVGRWGRHVITIEQVDDTTVSTARPLSRDEDHRHSESVRPAFAGLPTLGKK